MFDHAPPRSREAALNPSPTDAELDDFERRLRAVAPAEPVDDGCILDPPFDVGLIGQWLQRPHDDPGADDAHADAVAAHLAECAGCRALVPHLSEPLAPALVARMVDSAAPRRRRWIRPAAVGAIVALAAAVMLTVLRPAHPLPPAGFDATPIAGAVALDKSAPTSGTRFVPTSRLRWIIKPAARLDVALPVRAYESAPPGAPLAPLPADAITMRGGGAVVLESRADALFGERYGPRALYVGIAAVDAALDDAVGIEPPADGAAIGGVRWHRVDIEYGDR